MMMSRTGGPATTHLQLEGYPLLDVSDVKGCRRYLHRMLNARGQPVKRSSVSKALRNVGGAMRAGPRSCSEIRSREQTRLFIRTEGRACTHACYHHADH